MCVVCQLPVNAYGHVEHPANMVDRIQGRYHHHTSMDRQAGSRLGQACLPCKFILLASLLLLQSLSDARQ